jgi:hypothetical protein
MIFRLSSPVGRVAAGVVVCSFAAAGPQPRPEAPTTPPSAADRHVVVVWSHEARANAARAPAASEAFRDPATGRFVEPPEAELLTAGPQRLSALLSTSTEGLVEEPVTAVPGGVRVNLRGRFRSATFAEHGPDGGLAVKCGEREPPVEAEAPSPPAPTIAGGDQ